MKILRFWYTHLVGTRRPEVQGALGRFRRMWPHVLQLVPEPENSHDSHAVQVHAWVGDGWQFVGYLPNRALCHVCEQTFPDYEYSHCPNCGEDARDQWERGVATQVSEWLQYPRVCVQAEVWQFYPDKDEQVGLYVYIRVVPRQGEHAPCIATNSSTPMAEIS